MCKISPSPLKEYKSMILFQTCNHIRILLFLGMFVWMLFKIYGHIETGSKAASSI